MAFVTHGAQGGQHFQEVVSRFPISLFEQRINAVQDEKHLRIGVVKEKKQERVATST